MCVQAGLMAELDEYLETLQGKHTGEGLLQLQLLSSWLSRAFAGVSYHQSVVLEKAGIGGALDDPWGDLAAPVRDSLLAYGPSTRVPQHSLHVAVLTSFPTFRTESAGPCIPCPTEVYFPVMTPKHGYYLCMCAFVSP